MSDRLDDHVPAESAREPPVLSRPGHARQPRQHWRSSARDLDRSGWVLYYHRVDQAQCGHWTVAGRALTITAGGVNARAGTLIRSLRDRGNARGALGEADFGQPMSPPNTGFACLVPHSPGRTSPAGPLSWNAASDACLSAKLICSERRRRRVQSAGSCRRSTASMRFTRRQRQLSEMAYG